MVAQVLAVEFGHQVKLGLENWYGWGHDTFNIFNDTRLRYTNVNGVPQPSEIFTYNTPLTQRTRMRNFAAFVQDRLTYPRFTVNLGLRWSYYDGELPEQTGGGGRWFPVATYPAVKTPYQDRLGTIDLRVRLPLASQVPPIGRRRTGGGVAITSLWR